MNIVLAEPLANSLDLKIQTKYVFLFSREVHCMTQDGCDPLLGVSFSPSGHLLALLSRSAIYLYQVSTTADASSPKLITSISGIDTFIRLKMQSSKIKYCYECVNSFYKCLAFFYRLTLTTGTSGA
jgi:hypothetical protein